MSKMEERTKPLLLKIAHGEPVRLDFLLQHRLAAWATKTAMVAEFSDPATAAIPQVDRAWMTQKWSRPQPGISG
jgi:hypothetical protein